MWCYSGKVGITKAAKNAKMIKGKREAAKSFIWCAVLEGFGWVQVEEKSCRMESFNPIYWRHASLKKKGAHHIISRANYPFSFSILRRSVGARHAKGGAEG